MLSLDALPCGISARVVSIEGMPSVVERMKELGLVEGTIVSVVRRSLFGGTVQLRYGSSTLAVRLPDTAAFYVESVHHTQQVALPEVHAA